MAIAAWRNMARPDGASPAQLFYNRRMKQLLPILPAQAESEEIDIRVRDEAAERAEKNSNKCTDPREHAKFKPGERVTVQDPASKKWSTTAIVLEEREHGNSYVLTTEGTDKTFIRGQKLLKPHSVPKHPVIKELPSPYTPQTTRSKTKSYLEATQTTMPKSNRYNKHKDKVVCRRVTTGSNVPYTGESRRGNNEPRGEQLRLVQSVGRCWDSPRFKPAPLHNDRHRNPWNVPTVQNLESEQDGEADAKRGQGKAPPHRETVRQKRNKTPSPAPAPIPAPIVVRPPPCPCTTRSPGGTQEVLSGLLLVIKQQAMQLQSQLLRENTRVLTDIQDVTFDVSTPITSTPKKNPQMDVTWLGRSSYNSPAYSGLMYTSQTPLASRSLPTTTSTASQTKPKKTLAATFCGYPSDDEEMDLV